MVQVKRLSSQRSLQDRELRYGRGSALSFSSHSSWQISSPRTSPKPVPEQDSTWENDMVRLTITRVRGLATSTSVDLASASGSTNRTDMCHPMRHAGSSGF